MPTRPSPTPQTLTTQQDPASLSIDYGYLPVASSKAAATSPMSSTRTEEVAEEIEVLFGENVLDFDAASKEEEKEKIYFGFGCEIDEETFNKLDGCCKYQIRGCSGLVGFAQVFKTIIDSNPNDVALEIQKLAFPWEFYMYCQLDKRIPEMEGLSGTFHE